MIDSIEQIFKLKKEGKVIGFTASTFDLGPHSGHDVMLMEAKQSCDFLVVALMTDPTISRKEKNAPVQTTFERWIQASSNRYIDMIIPYDTEQDLEDMLKIIMPDVRFVGEEYKGKSFTGSEIEGIKIIYNKRQHSFSSSSLRKRVCEKKECMK